MGYLMDFKNWKRIYESQHLLGEIQNRLNEENVSLTQIQQLLIDKTLMSPTLPSGKTSADGRLGPLTLNSIYQALEKIQGGTKLQGGTGSSPVKYPWIGSDGQASLKNLQDAKASDSNFAKWLEELKKLTIEQLTQVKKDLYAFRDGLKDQNGTKIDIGDESAYLVANQAIDDALKVAAGTQQQLTVGMRAESDKDDNAKGLKLKISKITPMCDGKVTEIEFENANDTTRPKLYGYYEKYYTSLKRANEGTKSVDPCTEISRMESFGSLKYTNAQKS